MGRASITSNDNDCFKFRVPTLRNVIETFPYFHHGTEKAQGFISDNLYDRSRHALKNVILYHLRGPINITAVNQQSVGKKFFDPFFQMDSLIPSENQNFKNLSSTLSTSDLGMKRDISGFETSQSIALTDDEVENLLDFVVMGLFDPLSTQQGDLGNDVSHPKSVSSGFKPTITRDHGNQLELPPAWR